MALRGHYKATTVNVQSARFLVVRHGTGYCALPAEGVRGVLTPEEAGARKTIVQVGVTYHEIDLAGLLATKADTTSPDKRTVLFTNGHSHGAIRVDEVIGLFDVVREQCLPLPPHFQREERTWVLGLIVFRDRELALILNPEWVLGELGEVATAAIDGDARSGMTASMEVGKLC
jgi:hypothetical protein